MLYYCQVVIINGERRVGHGRVIQANEDVSGVGIGGGVGGVFGAGGNVGGGDGDGG